MLVGMSTRVQVRRLTDEDGRRRRGGTAMTAGEAAGPPLLEMLSDSDVKVLLTSGVVPACYYAERPADRPDCELLGVDCFGPITLCADCDRRRSSVGKAMTALRLPDPSALLVLVRARRACVEADLALRRAVEDARRVGHPWSSLGTLLGTTRQAVQQRFSAPAPERSTSSCSDIEHRAGPSSQRRS
jgi:hypothetical protein